MEDFVLIDGDQVFFMPNFGPAIVLAPPGQIEGTGEATLKGKPMCVDGDEKNVEVANVIYFAPPFIIPGLGTVKIKELAGDQKATKTKTGGKAVLLKGNQFTAKFEVKTKAKQPNPPAPPVDDPMSDYTGNGTFMTTNTHFKGT